MISNSAPPGWPHPSSGPKSAWLTFPLACPTIISNSAARMPVISSSHSLVLFVSVRGNTVLLDTRTQMFGTIFHCLHAFITHTQVVTNYHYFFLEKFLESSWFGLLSPCVKMYLHLPQALSVSPTYIYLISVSVLVSTSTTVVYTIFIPPIPITSSRLISSNTYWKYLPGYLSGISNLLSSPQKACFSISVTRLEYNIHHITLDITFTPPLIPSTPGMALRPSPPPSDPPPQTAIALAFISSSWTNATFPFFTLIDVREFFSGH